MPATIVLGTEVITDNHHRFFTRFDDVMREHIEEAFQSLLGSSLIKRQFVVVGCSCVSPARNFSTRRPSSAKKGRHLTRPQSQSRVGHRAGRTVAPLDHVQPVHLAGDRVTTFGESLGRGQHATGCSPRMSA